MRGNERGWARLRSVLVLFILVAGTAGAFVSGVAVVTVASGSVVGETSGAPGAMPRFESMAVPVTGPQSPALSDAARTLLTSLGFSAGEMAQATAGTAVARIIAETGDESAQAGAVWMAVPVDYFTAQFAAIESFEKSDALLAIEKMARPPAEAGLAGLDFPESGLEDLRSCRVGECAVKIGRSGLELVQQQVDWSASDAVAKAQQVMRQVLFGYMTGYEQKGVAALPTFIDKSDPTSVKAELDAIIADTPSLPQHAPALHGYLQQFPAGQPADAVEFFYWSVANIGLKPIVTIDHAIVAPPENDVTAIAVVQLYASHYFYAALQLYYLMPGPTAQDGFMLVALNRSHSDGLTGFTGRIVRGKAERRGRDALQGMLASTKQRLEAQHRQR